MTLIYPSLDSLEAVEGTFDQRILWSDCADVQADQSLRWSHVYCRFCRALAQLCDILFGFIYSNLFLEREQQKKKEFALKRRYFYLLELTPDVPQSVVLVFRDSS